MKERAKRIHITSSGPRTGTTLLAEVMKTCFEIDCYCDHEAPISLSNSSFGDCCTILTKKPSSTVHLDKAISWDPSLFVICLIRDPRDMVCSYHGRIQDKYYCDLEFWFNFVENYKKLKGNKRVLLIKYEDLTEHPNLVQKQIMKEMPFLSKKHDFSDFHLYAKPVDDSVKALKKLRPIESKGIGNWKNHLPRIKHQFEQYPNLEDTLVLHGYETSKEWVEALAGVEYEDYESHRKLVHSSEKTFKTLVLIYLNIFLEKKGLNPEIWLAPFKKIF